MKRTVLSLLSIPILALSLAAVPAMADDHHGHDQRPHDGGQGRPDGHHDHHDHGGGPDGPGGPWGHGDGRGFRGGPPPRIVDRGPYGPPPRMDYRPYRGHFGPPPPRYRPYAYERGYRYNYYYSGRPVVIDDYDYYHVAPPPYGYRWVRDDRGNLIMIAIATGIITDLLLRH